MQNHNAHNAHNAHDAHTKSSVGYDEVILASSKRVACDGGVAGHPRVWLTLDGDSHQVVCPYCSRLYAGEEAAIWEDDSTSSPPSPNSQNTQARQDDTDG